VKTVQSLMRHATSNITMNIYTHAVSSKKRQAQSKVMEMIRGSQKRPSRRESLSVHFLV
jgi:integrase